MNEPKPFTSAELGGMYIVLDVMLLRHLFHVPDDLLHQSLMLKDKIRKHFIAAGGDLKMLEGE